MDHATVEQSVVGIEPNIQVAHRFTTIRSAGRRSTTTNDAPGLGNGPRLRDRRNVELDRVIIDKNALDFGDGAKLV